MIIYYSATVNDKCHCEMVIPRKSSFMLAFGRKMGRYQQRRLKRLLRVRGVRK